MTFKDFILGTFTLLALWAALAMIVTFAAALTGGL